MSFIWIVSVVLIVAHDNFSKIVGPTTPLDRAASRTAGHVGHEKIPQLQRTCGMLHHLAHLCEPFIGCCRCHGRAGGHCEDSEDKSKLYKIEAAEEAILEYAMPLQYPTIDFEPRRAAHAR